MSVRTPDICEMVLIQQLKVCDPIGLKGFCRLKKSFDEERCLSVLDKYFVKQRITQIFLS